MSENIGEILKIIEKYGLSLASKRECPLLTMDSVAKGYLGLMRSEIGFSYGAVAAFGGQGKFQTLFNERDISQKTETFIRDHPENIEQMLRIADDIFSELAPLVKEMEKNSVKNPSGVLATVVKIYPRYMSGIGIYNCFWRYIGNEPERTILTSDQIERILSRRERMAVLYPRIEQVITRACELHGIDKGFEGDLLRYCTTDELAGHVSDPGRIKENMFHDLLARRRGYFYLKVGDRSDQIVTDPDLIRQLKEEIIPGHTETVAELKGFSAFHGIVSGRVYNAWETVFGETRESFQKGDIFVTSMTKPEDVSSLAKAGAVITDEGGILSHAAIVCRELRKPCIIGTHIATKVLKDGDIVLVDASNNEGVVCIERKTEYKD